MEPHLDLHTPFIGMVILLLLSSSSLKVMKVDAAQLSVAPIGLPGCQTTCGNVSGIPFPFGIGPNCFLDPWYEIKCEPFPHPNSSTTPFLSKLHVQVLEIVLDSFRVHCPGFIRIPIQTMTVSIPPLKACTADMQCKRLNCIDLRGGPYNFSTDGNIFSMKGCAGSAVLVNQTGETIAGCTTVCRNHNSAAIPAGSKCYPVECCQSQLPSMEPLRLWGPAYSPLQFYHIDFYGQPPASGDPQNCMVATLMKEDSSTEYIGNSSTSDLAWCIRDEGTNLSTTSCQCRPNSFGNPYLFDGCRVFFMAFGPLLLVFGCRWLNRFIKSRSKNVRRVKAYKLRLQQHQSTTEGVVERTKLFTHKQLDKATNHFNENRILGKGGQGIVYKGMLDDGRTVAVKTLKMMDESQMEQFINEVIILSQINHRNVVKLLGCCLEREVPLLVYEFIPNGTLSQHIHDPDEDFVLSWAMRLKIAADAAGAIAYLHSYSSIPIYHRDIKSLNILLDDKYKAKVSDFGSSKTTSIDQTHLTTLVRGTWGYLDPEYVQSNQFTDKSDVYSFGVVLLELLTGKKPIYRDESMERKSLVIEFILKVQNSQLVDIFDPQVVNEAKAEEMVAVADLAKRCLNESGRLRPTMREVAMALDMIIKSPTEMPTQDQQSFADEEFNENVMAEISDVDFMSSPLPADVGNSLYIDEQPLMHDTI